MSLIRCLGPVRLPASYRKHLNYEADTYRRKRLYEPDAPNEWVQDFILPAAFECNGKTHEIRGHRFPVTMPIQCEKLTAHLRKLYKGKQSHTAMTLVSTEVHSDKFNEQNATLLFIPYKVSNCHILQVEDEKRQLKANHIYAFSQFRPHALLYEGNRPENSESSPCSALVVSFKKLRI